MKHILKVLLVLLMFAAVASATTLHVGAGQTYSTIPEAFANVVAGDTIEIHEGTYTEFPNVSGSGTNLNNITFQRHGDDVVVIDLASYIYMRYRTGNKFIGLIFDFADTGGHGIYLRSSTHYTQFIDCVFYGAASAGIYAYGGSGWITGIVVDNCTFYNLRHGHPAQQLCFSTVVTDCLFVNNTTACNAISNYSVHGGDLCVLEQYHRRGRLCRHRHGVSDQCRTVLRVHKHCQCRFSGPFGRYPAKYHGRSLQRLVHGCTRPGLLSACAVMPARFLWAMWPDLTAWVKRTWTAAWICMTLT